MASVGITSARASEREGASSTPGRRRVVLTGTAGSVTLDVTNPETTVDRLASEYAELARPGRKPLLEWAGSRLAVIRLEATLDGRVAGWFQDVEWKLKALRTMADPVANRAVVLSYSPWETDVSRSGHWNITDLTVRAVMRREEDNRIYRARVEVELTEHSPAPGQTHTTPGSIGPPPPSTTTPKPTIARITTAVAAPTAPPRTSATRRYTVRAGDTLWAIAERHYGDGNLWGRIADANGVRDPRRLAIGAVLTIP